MLEFTGLDGQNAAVWNGLTNEFHLLIIYLPYTKKHTSGNITLLSIAAAVNVWNVSANIQIAIIAGIHFLSMKKRNNHFSAGLRKHQEARKPAGSIRRQMSFAIFFIAAYSLAVPVTFGAPLPGSGWKMWTTAL